MNMKDFILARATAARHIATNMVDLIDELTLQLVDGEGTKKEYLETVEAVLDDSGVLSRCFEVIQQTIEQTDIKTLKEGEPNYDDYIDDGEEDEGSNDN